MKNNIRSIRFSDELAELIDQQIGDNFTQKFENLITRCVWELPGKERELTRINENIIEKRKLLGRLTEKAQYYHKELESMSYKMQNLSITIAKMQEHT